MENVRIVIFVSFLSVFILVGRLISYEAPSTHPGLTSEIIKFYESKNGSTFSNSEKESIIKGSIDEDNDRRFFNHFYDPVNNIGLTFGKQFITSKQWVNDVEAQGKFLDPNDYVTYKFEKRFNHEGDYTWDRAIYDYVYDDKNRALESLGHVLHLIEDLTVPDHTRNDPHPNIELFYVFDDAFNQASPYEVYTNRYDRETISVSDELNNNGDDIVVKDSLSRYFDDLATFSNNNFFSRSTLPNTNSYKLPEVDISKVVYIDSYAYVRSKTLPDLFISGIEVKRQEDNTESFDYYLNSQDNLIMSSYWSILSKEAVKNGAGVIDLFFREVERERQTGYLKSINTNPFMVFVNKTTEKAKEVTRKVINTTERGIIKAKDVVWGSITKINNTLTNLIGGYFGANIAGSIDNQSSNNTQISNQSLQDVAQESNNINNQSNDNNTDTTNNSIISDTTFNSLLSQNVAQDGLNNNSTDGSTESNLIQIARQIQEAQSQIRALERLVNITVSNQNSQNNGGNVINQNSNGGTNTPTQVSVVVSPTGSPAEEDNEPTQSVTVEEEVSIEEEMTTTTPKAEITSITIDECDQSISNDSCLLLPISELTLNFEITDYEYSYINVNVSDVTATTSDNTLTIDSSSLSGDITIEATLVYIDDTISEAFSIEITINPSPIVINEIAWMGGPTSSNDEWIELYNNTEFDIDLSDFNLYTEDGNPEIELSGTISSGNYYLLERKDDETVSDIDADLIYGNDGASFALNNSGEILYLALGDYVLDQTPIIDDWVAGDNSAKCSMERYDINVSGTDESNWMTAVLELSNGLDIDSIDICGSPKSKNTVSYLINKGENISDEITLNSNYVYVIIGNQDIEETGHLKIPDGVIIKFYDSSSSLSVSGDLDMNGSASDNIVFTSFYDKGLDLDYGESITESDSQGYGFFVSDGANINGSNVKWRPMVRGIIMSGGETNLSNVIYESSVDGREIDISGGRFIVDNFTYYSSGNTRRIFSAEGDSYTELSNLVIADDNIEERTLFSASDDAEVLLNGFDRGVLEDTGISDLYDDSVVSVNNISLNECNDTDLFETYDNSELTIVGLTITEMNCGIVSQYNDSVAGLQNITITNSGDSELLEMYDDSNLEINDFNITNVGDGGIAYIDGSGIVNINDFNSESGSYIGFYISGDELEFNINNSTLKGFDDTALYVESSLTTIDNVIFENNFIGLYAENIYDSSNSITITNSDFINNTIAGVWNDTGPPQTITATGNYWGDQSGPYNENDNPDGLGDIIIGEVMFDPWAVE